MPVGDLKAAGDRLVVASVNFTPNPVTSRTAPITARVKITARGGRPVSGASVFMRATPRVVEGQTQTTGADGFVTLTLVPNNTFPQPRSGFNVQFFIKASGRATRGSAASPATGSCRSGSLASARGTHRTTRGGLGPPLSFRKRFVTGLLAVRK